MSVDKHGPFWFPQTIFVRSLVILSFKKLNKFSTIWSKKTIQISLCEKLERIAPFTSGGTCEKLMKNSYCHKILTSSYTCDKG